MPSELKVVIGFVIFMVLSLSWVVCSAGQMSNKYEKYRAERRQHYTLESMGIITEAKITMVYDGVQAIYIKTDRDKSFELRRGVNDNYTSPMIHAEGMTVYYMDYTRNYLVVGRRIFIHGGFSGEYDCWVEDPSDHTDVFNVLDSKKTPIKD